MKKNPNLEKSFALAKERYAETGVDVDRVLKNLEKVPVSLHCWQGDDVGGFENFGGSLGGGLVATGNYPGKARTPQELRADAEKALSLIPGKHRFNVHAFYGEFGGKKVDRNEIKPEHFKNWIDWASPSALVWISTRPASRIPRPPTVSHCRTRTRAFANSGSSTARPAAKSAPPWARRSARPPSPTSGFPTA